MANENYPHVVIHVSGGVVEVMHVPVGVRVEVLDFDVGGCDPEHLVPATAELPAHVFATYGPSRAAAAVPEFTLNPWTTPAGDETRLYINSPDFDEGVKVYLTAKGQTDGHWTIRCYIPWTTDKAPFVNGAYAMLFAKYGREFISAATWSQMLALANPGSQR